MTVQGIKLNHNYIFDIITQRDVLSNLIAHNSKSAYDEKITKIGNVFTKLNTSIVSVLKIPLGNQRIISVIFLLQLMMEMGREMVVGKKESLKHLAHWNLVNLTPRPIHLNW